MSVNSAQQIQRTILPSESRNSTNAWVEGANNNIITLNWWSLDGTRTVFDNIVI